MIRSEDCKRRNCAFYGGFYCQKTGEQLDIPNSHTCPEENYNFWDDDFN